MQAKAEGVWENYSDYTQGYLPPVFPCPTSDPIAQTQPETSLGS